MIKVYIATRLKTRQYKLKRNPPMNIIVRDHIKSNQKLKRKIKKLPLQITHSLGRSIDPYQDEEVHETVQSFLQTKDGALKGIRSYKKISKVIAKRKNKGVNAKVVRRSWQSKNMKSATITRKMNTSSNAIQLRTMNSKYVRKDNAVSKVINKGAKKALVSSTNYLKMTSKRLAKKVVIMVKTNPKFWLIGVGIAGAFLFMMLITNSLGSSTSAAGSMFMVDDNVAVNYKTKVDELNTSFQQRIDNYRKSGYDDVRIDYMNEEGTLLVSWAEILSIVAVKYEQDLEFSIEQQNYMTELFNYFNEIKTSEETYTEQICSTNKEGKTKCHGETRTRLIVKVYTYDMEQVFDKIGFNEEQREWARRLVSEGTIQDQFPNLAGGYTGGSSSLTPEELQALLQNLGGDIEKARLAVIETALTLEGKVGYFWGGKSPPGWNSNWGMMFLVTAPGSDKTGTNQPYGLDCSGFIDWVFKTAGLGNVFSAGGTSYQWTRTSQISKDEMKPGDLIFKDMPGQGGINHIGIFIGKDQNNNNLYIHCQSGTGVVINSYKGFKYPRRPLLFQ
ncbi:C40 family peptidase [Paenibacillus sp. KQZ6P-2]|uniref:C40 family peptidase n=1 Tax=Paenibacillus mangrovi TaxID=2931978 RepID=A0A9X1WJI6_9BACL|nr:C40 family peptidase [Paenibacillus mangrovi]MCJ8010148.1 C40 family peptidase [Paenibacillus mangrovi]